ncbi:MAG: CsbD family protein [Rhodococcus sp. (in: high G+C Gram-positive bacteria)]|uniref:CsbD family protein n=1 Tax=Rhodococcus sp. TaxID=1831 RepID=UPI003BAEC72E
MGIVDKAKNAMQHTVGKSRESIGRATGDKELKHVGKADQAKANVKKAGEKIKGAFKR